MSVHAPLLLLNRRSAGAAPELDMAGVSEVIASELRSATAPCVSSSLQASGVVLVHMLREVMPDIPVLFLDTFHHFPETIRYRDQLVEGLKLNLVTVHAPKPMPGLWERDTDACCARHKVDPLFGALENHDLWFTGLRRQQSRTRADLGLREMFRLPSGREIRKVSPLAAWSREQVWAYAERHHIPLLPLYDQGYTSIGCEPCTAVPVDPSDERSGRWGGQKLECGIHVQRVD